MGVLTCHTILWFFFSPNELEELIEQIKLNLVTAVLTA